MAGDNSTDTVDAAESSAEPSAAQLQAQLEELHKEHAAWRELARNRAIQGFKDGVWGLDSLNDTLKRLELESFEPRYVSRTDATIEFQIEVDELDQYRAREAMGRLQEEETRNALREAIAKVVQERTADGVAVTVTDLAAHVSVGYSRRQLA